MRKILLIISFASLLFADKNLTIKMDGIHCPLCTAVVRKAVLLVDGVKTAKADMKSKILTISADDGVSEDEILKSLKDVNYPGVIIK
ncbi:heavy-metal-associated domain-containing protein [Campylobacter mucosalis]|uniref:heavy-metal-associated domain-containing protein n=1 Tax=Campylobacter mucosalis TaxID=202 RepID=UPI0014702FE1|nr:heavy-metal-associated domain-containing protein [Campylobacter mucosalis]